MEDHLDPSDRSKVLLLRGGARIDRAQFDPAKHDLDQALSLARELADRPLEGLCLNQLVKAHSRQGRHQKALHFSDQAVDLFRTAGLPQRLGVALMYRSILFDCLGRFDDAEAGYDQALEVLAVEGDLLSLSRLYANLSILGELYRDDGQYSVALSAYKRAWELNSRVGDRTSSAIALIGRAEVFTELGQTTRARRCLDQAQKNPQVIGYEWGGFAEVAQACLDFEEGQINAAKRHIRRAIERFSHQTVPTHEAIARFWLGCVQRAVGQLSEAQATFQQVAQDLESRENRLAKPLIVLSQTLHKLVQFDRSETSHELPTLPWKTLRHLLGLVVPNSPNRLFPWGETNASFDSYYLRMALNHVVKHLNARDATIVEAYKTAPRFGCVVVAPNADWFSVDGQEPVNIAERSVLKRILLSLVDRRLSTPGLPVEAEALVDQGWPDEAIIPKAASMRLYSATSTLRSLGLGRQIVNQDRGYLIDPHQLIIVPSSTAESGFGGK